MSSYSVAIRTLGLAPAVLQQELQSIFKQTVLPDKVIVYIAYGYQIPEFRVASEQYVYVKKGMAAQRALPYDEIDTPYMLLLDDDVVLAPDSAARMIHSLESGSYDCVAADTFHNHRMSWKNKVYCALTNMSLPSVATDKAFRIRRSGAFSYNNHPSKEVYPSDSAAGPASMWRKQSFLAVHFEHELWLDDLGFAYGEDQILFNKVVKNGMKLGVHYASGIEHMDAKTSSGDYHRDPLVFMKRSRGQYLLWYRSCYHLSKSGRFTKFLTAMAFVARVLWQTPANIGAAILQRNLIIPYYYVKGYWEGYKWVRTARMNQLPSYQLY